MTIKKSFLFVKIIFEKCNHIKVFFDPQRDLQLVFRIRVFCYIVNGVNYFFKLIKMAVKLSELLLRIAYFITSSTHIPLILCVDSPTFLLIVLQIIRLTSTDYNFSKIPSHPKNRKSSLSSIINLVISG